ncbi:MAG TPA: phosphopantetheine-binding protein, partial [Chitinophagaceae bacterium]|nr:phosphopantetheine-binding protein [Chitinophagaceae bacterium]
KENKTGIKQLVGYVVPEGEFIKENLVAYLEEQLPKYMVPTLWVEMEKLPVTENGKIDRKSLPEPTSTSSKNNKSIVPKTEAEKALQEIWQELLKIQDVDVEDNFFELGGHSMMVLQLVNRVRKLGVEINPKDLFKYQTIEQQSKFINTSLKLLNAASGGEYVIPIQPHGDKIPLFAFSEFLLYAKVGEYISKDQPFYSMEPSPYEKPEEIAAHYIREIKKIYPNGPYCLAGFCRWGSIAVEMAQAFVAQGEEVPLLILIEYYSPKALRSRMSPKFLGPKMKYFYNSIKEKPSYLDKGKLFVEGIINVSEYVYDSVTGRYSKSRLGSKTYSGKVALVKASERYEFKENCNMGWSDNFIGEIENITIEGDHLNIMRNPAAAQLADKINKALDKVNEEYRASMQTSVSA